MMSRIFCRLLLLAGLWWLLAGRDATSWLFGGPVILVLAAWRLSDVDGAGGRLRLRRLPVFVAQFAWRTLVGSCDVAWRALDRRLPIYPVVYDYPRRLPVGGPARVFFANSVNLLPGTLTAAWEDDVLRVHVLTSGPQAMSELRTLEGQIASLFGHTRAHDQEDTVT